MGQQKMVVHAWKEWGIQALVLLSFTVQVVLLVLAEFRRRVRSGALMFFIWSAYMLADATAIYVLGHMSMASRSPEHELVAFWAPFLLLHLGGQDNITAYSIEDNRLWLRHLQAFALQVAAAANVLYESPVIASGQTLLRWATILMFLVGAVKYGERVLALRLASRSTAGENYETRTPPRRSWFLDKVASDAEGCIDARDTEIHIVMAHRMLHVPKNLLKESVPDAAIMYRLRGVSLYKVVEMQLSLMHDIFYTKREIIHNNWYGICIHMLSAAAVATAFVLFNLAIWNDHDGKDTMGYNKVDVAITFVLLVGAVVLETLSLLRVAFSCWAFSVTDDLYRFRCPYCLSRMVSVAQRFVHAAGWRGRYWSASMGQHNLLQLSARRRASRSSKIARWMGLEDLWNTQAYSWSIPVSSFIEESLMNQVFLGLGEDVDEEGQEAGLTDLGYQMEEVPDLGEEALMVWRQGLLRKILRERVPEKLIKGWGLYKGGLNRSIEERILVWHVATNIYLTWWYEEHGGKQPKEEHGNIKKQPNKAEVYKAEHSKQPTAEAVEALSNYMVFLLAARPDMLSRTGSRSVYVEACYALGAECPRCKTAEELARKLRRFGYDMLKDEGYRDTPRNYGFDAASPSSSGGGYRLPWMLQIGCKVGAMLIDKHAADTLDVIAQVWVETLCHAAQGCSAYAHAKQLSNGGEFITVAAILMEYLNRRVINFFGK